MSSIKRITSRRRGILGLLCLIALTSLSCGGTAPPETVVFIVLDNVRADHLSTCGYQRPTSAGLSWLHEQGATLTCRAYAPSPWTLPTHASYFTGTEVPEHGAHRSPRGTDFGWAETSHLLGDELPTLAEQFDSRGFQTIAVSANPVVSQLTGLTRGFERQKAAKAFGELDGTALVTALAELLSEHDAEKPLFLFVNIIDAHEPWADIPEGLDWVEAQSGGRFDIGRSSPFVRYTRGEMSDEEAQKFVSWYRDIYDYGIFRADVTLGEVILLLQESGRFNSETRLVVTSDHGELLGEHRRVGHCCATLEPVVKVPVLYYAENSAFDLPEPFPALASYWLVRDGSLPDPLPPIRALAETSEKWKQVSDRIGHDVWASAWHGSLKLQINARGPVRYDLSEDPHELSPTQVSNEQRLRELQEFRRRGKESIAREATPHPKADELLRGLGYIQ